MPSTIQRSFAGGEIAPALYGRADQIKYQTGLQICRNFLVMRHGGVANRPGTRFVTEVKDSTKAVRLVKFVFNTSQTYVLEFGDLYMRVIKNGVQLKVGGVPYEIVTPYVAADLRSLQYVQSGDVITIVHKSYAPRTLARTGDTAWTLSTLTFAPSIAAPTTPAASPAGTANYYVVTAVKAETFEESLPTSEVGSSTAAPTTASPVTITWTAVSGAQEYNVYKKKNGVFGYIGVAQGTSFKDDGLSADVTETPPQSRNPFPTANDYPGVVSYYQQRQLFASSTNNPEKVWMSRTGNYKNFSIRSPLQDDDAVTFTIAGRQVNKIEHLLEIGNMLILTSGGEWLILGDADGVVRPSAINLKQQGYTGSSSIPPIVVGNNALYVQARGTVCRDLRYDFQSDGYTGRDLTVFAAHLFDGYQIVAWDYAQIPHSIVWTVRSDGTLLGLTYVREHEVWGWHRHDTDGLFEDVVAVPEGNEDSIYVVVQRTVNGVSKRYIERFAPRATSQTIDIKRDAFFVDCGGTYDGKNAGATTLKVDANTGLTVQQTQFLVASAGSFTAGEVGNAYDLTVGSVTIRFSVLEYVSATVLVVQPSKNIPAGFAGVTSTNWSRCVDEISGLSFLIGKTVAILADGNVHPQRVVDGTGKITLDRPYSVVHVGLPYLSTIKTLALDAQNAETISDKHKIINKVSMQVESSRGIFAGPDQAHLREYKQRQYEPYNEPVALATRLVEVQTIAQWDKNAQVTVEQQDPIPITILSIVPQVTVAPK